MTIGVVDYDQQNDVSGHLSAETRQDIINKRKRSRQDSYTPPRKVTIKAAPVPYEPRVNPRISQHASATIETWKNIQLLKTGQRKLALDGAHLDIASVVAASRYSVHPEIENPGGVMERRLKASVDTLAEYLDNEYTVYGVNTGYGGSADTRISEVMDLQVVFMQFLQSGIITQADLNPKENSERVSPHVFPPEWVRATMIARANQNLRGHSAIRLEVLETLVRMLQHDILPLIPLRGSISASGDLMPLSFIAGALFGNPEIMCQIGRGKDLEIISADKALARFGISPPVPGPKEALGLVNGTAPSVTAASLVLHDSQQLACLSQMLTAFASEALGGNVEWALPFVHNVRPHLGQVEAATNIRRMLNGSDFVQGLKSRRRKGDGLWQDRYSTRTAPQWLSPYLEDLLLAQGQLEVELNSTSDNPLIEANETADGHIIGDVYNGGNFQATAITSAMEKTRLALQMIGRMLFSQTSEMINPITNNGLEANLNVCDSESFTMKGIDINMAAYASELAALAHPVSAHVLSAEMHNQGINSLALISTRRTMEAADVVAHMAACQIFVSCQAVEIRASHLIFWETFEAILRDAYANESLAELMLSKNQLIELAEILIPVAKRMWYKSNQSTWRERIQPTVDAAVASFADFLVNQDGIDSSISQLAVFRKHFHKSIQDTASSHFYPNQLISPDVVAAKLGDGAAQLYTYVRAKLGVTTQLGITEDPLYNSSRGLSTEGKLSRSAWLSKIYESLKSDFMDMVMHSLDSARPKPNNKEEYERLAEEMKERF